MNTYIVPVERKAVCVLKAAVKVEADSPEEAQNGAIGMAENDMKPDAFAVAEIDLTAFEGSTKVLP